MSGFSFNKVSVIGLGYIGLPTAATFAAHNINVTGVDIDSKIVDKINQGKVHIIEPGLEALVKQAIKAKLLSATLVPEAADAHIIAVPTPFDANKKPSLDYVKAAATAIAPILERGNLVVLESTSPVGATDSLVRWLAEARPDLSFPHEPGEASDVRVAYCPERVLPGKVIQELITNDRIIGGVTEACSASACALYKIFVSGDCIVASSPRVAEMTKLTENSFRDVNIAFANELSIICDKLDINVWELISLANRHPRVDILQPGPGVGGHCIAVDPWFIVSSAPEIAEIIRAGRNVNDKKTDWVIEKIKHKIEEMLSEKDETEVSVSIYGISFKPDIDDLRESPALRIAEEVTHTHGGPVLIVEPNIRELPSILAKAKHVDFNTAKNADINVLLVDHGEFKTYPPPNGIKIDFKGMWSRK